MTDLSRVSDLSAEAKRTLLAQLLRDKVRSAKSYPLSFAQERLWFLSQFQPGLPFYNIPMPIRWPGPLNVSALEQTLNEIVRRHEVLRTTFQVVDGKPVQMVSPARPLSLPQVDLRSMPKAIRDVEAQRLAGKEAAQIFDLAKGPLFRSLLVQLDDADQLLLLTMHHIVSDGWSIGVLLRELNEIYQAYSSGRASPLAEPPIQYADFALWQRQYLSGAVLESHLSYWRKQLEGAPAVLELPSDRLRPAVQTYRGAWQSFVLDRRVYEELQRLSQREGVTMFMTLLSAFEALLYRYTGQEDLVVGTTIANRNRAEIEGLIGFFVNTLVLRVKLAGNPRFRDLLSQVREVTLAAYEHQDLPFEKLVGELQPERHLSHNPLFQVMFSLQNTPTMPRPAAAPVRDSSAAPSQTAPQVTLGTAKFDLTLSMAETADGLMTSFEYNTDLFDHETITRMMGHFRTLLKGISAAPEQRVSDLPLMTETERGQILNEWNDTKTPFPENAGVHELFDAQARRTPEATALVFAGLELSYGKLNAQANQLAHYLRKLGVGPDVRVAVCVERSFELIVAVLGILKAGGAYLPLDPDYPKQRLAYMLEDAQAPVLITRQLLQSSLPKYVARIVDLDAEREDIARESDSTPTTAGTPDNLIAVLYTSGSTGTPKGILEHTRGFVSLLNFYKNACELTEKSRAISTTSFTFDAWFKPAIAPLLAGGLVVLPDIDLYDVEKLVQLIEEQKISTMFSTPTLLYPLIELAARSDYKALASLESLSFGGEPTDLAKLRPWLTSPHCRCRLLHCYGPSECSDVATLYEPTPSDLKTASHLPIGRPIDNAKVYVLDRCFGLNPIGVPGELYISGLGPSRGYLNKPALTAEKFVADPFSWGSRMYRTGDLAKWTPNGDIEFLGRIDHQIKIRGIRVELGEIESVLGQHPAVKDAAVFVREDGAAGGKRLVGYIVLKEQQTVTVGDLRLHLRARLPEYMMPAAFLIVDALPISPNGKVDRKALALMAAEAPVQDSFVAPRTPLEEVLAGIWREVLSLTQISIHDNFFELGGHSLLATQVISRVRDSLQIELPVRRLFESPTVAELSASILQDSDDRDRIKETADLLLKVVQLSDSDVESLLDAKGARVDQAEV